MKTNSRLLEYQGKVLKDSKGLVYEGERVINYSDPKSPFKFSECCIKFHKGKIHCSGNYAVYFVDGHKEWWENGKFITATPSYALQDKTPLD